jgi:hypothetical protein
MQSDERAETRRIDLLRFNYENLHTSVADAHRFAWAGISVFLPIIFTLQGFLVREHGRLTWAGVLAGAIVVEGLAVTWWLMMKLIRYYNKQRITLLKGIEAALNRQIGPEPEFKQYAGFEYNAVMGRAVSPMRIYRGLFITCSAINTALVVLRAVGVSLTL